MSTPATKVLVLGIDAGSPDLLDEWIADGTLPNLAALAARGLVARTRGIEGFFVGSTWASLYTVRSTLAPLRDRAVRDEGVRVGAPGIGIDVDRSRCFPLANGLAVSGIRLNLAGREPRGMLAPGDEEARFVAQLEADLLRSSTM